MKIPTLLEKKGDSRILNWLSYLQISVLDPVEQIEHNAAGMPFCPVATPEPIVQDQCEAKTGINLRNLV
jgi:hypothetical protein